jgi:EamA domain-containing membrane protein RarD
VLQVAFVAVGLALAMLALWRFCAKRVALTAAVLWLAYAVYEFLMHKRVLCSGECNIRVDLLLIWPILLGMTLSAIFQATKHRKSQR